MAASKNQRSGPKQAPRKRFCEQGHEQVPVLYTDRGFLWVCGCVGYEPIDIKAPYKQIPAQGLPGKKRDGVKSRGARLMEDGEWL